MAIDHVLTPFTQDPPVLASTSGNLVHFGSTTINLDWMEAEREGMLVKLTFMEFKLLRYLIYNPRRVITRQELLDGVWGYANYPSTRTVDTFIWRLRRLFEKSPSRPVHFLTVHGAGYRFIP